MSAQTMTGRVVSSGMQSTIAVEIERRVRHPLYKKYVRRYTRVLAHDADNQCQVGDSVTIQECRPLSRRKSWVLLEIHDTGGQRSHDSSVESAQEKE